MNQYELAPEVSLKLNVSGSDSIEVSFSGRLKWVLKDEFSDTIYRTGFIGFNTYLIQQIPKDKFIILEVESFEPEETATLYVTHF